MTRPVEAVFEGGGQVGRDLAAVDWAATPLGPSSGWPESLRSAVRIVLTSRFSMWMCWGPQLTFFCNEAYRRDTLASKYPWALGRPTSQVWAEIWADIGPRIQHVLDTGEATWDEGLLLFLERSGYREETYHTFSYSPLADEGGGTVGMLCVVAEETERVVAARRLALLRDVAAGLSGATSETAVHDAACRTLAGDGQSLPFALSYRLAADGTAHLAGTSGARPGEPVAPEVLDPGSTVWPVAQAVRGRTTTVPALTTRFRDVPCGGWTEPPQTALVVPYAASPDADPAGFLVAALNPYRPLDDGYRAFVSLVAGQVAASLASARAYEAERDRAERLAELDRAKTAFFTNVSHELRTPLTLLLGPAEDALLDLDDPLPPRQRERVEVVERNAQRLLKLVNTLLDFSRLEAGGATGTYEPVDLAGLTSELAAAFASATDRAGLTLAVDCPPLPEPVWVDPEMWSKIVLNLLSNALKFTFEGGITVRLRAGDGQAVLEVADTGTGIAPADQQRLFERFARVGGARSRSHEGTGIGLALVAELAALHGGGTAVRSTPGRGSTFTVRVRLGRDHLPQGQLVRHQLLEGPPDPAQPDPGQPAPGQPDPGQPAQGAGADGALARRVADGYLAEAQRWSTGAGSTGATSGPVPGGRPRVLVVDDNADMRGHVARLLASAYDVVTAPDGAVGLQVALAHPPDLILTDVMMPALDGFGLLRRLREEPRTSSVPVVMLSARAGEEATVGGLEAGADDYLVKPFSTRELLARVRANLELDRARRSREHLERSQQLLDQAQRLARVGSWELDLATGHLQGSAEYLRQLQDLGVPPEELDRTDFTGLVRRLVVPDQEADVLAALRAAADGGGLDHVLDMRGPRGTRTFRAVAELVADETGRGPGLIRGSLQDITRQRQVDAALASAAANREAAAREHRIADELQASLLPARTFDPDHLTIATYYRAGVEGTQVGGDWYDVIELGAGRTALVLGDVMGRGVRAAAVMGQLRTAVRAYARLDLPPADVLENLDAAVREIGEDQIVTCVYAVYDPGDRTLTYANAGHLPPLLVPPGSPPRRLTGVASPPLGTALPGVTEQRVALEPGALVALYTDGLVERRGVDLDDGISALQTALAEASPPLEDLPDRLVRRLLPEGPDDDIAILLVQVEPDAHLGPSVALPVALDLSLLSVMRARVQATLREWDVAPGTVDDVVLLVSELATNAVIHGRPPAELRLRRTGSTLVLEVEDHASYLPRRMRPTADDEHGRGLQLTALLADRWGTRPTRDGKVVWCVFRTP